MNNKHRSFISVVGVSLVLITLASGFFLHRVSGANYNDQITQTTPATKNLLGAKLEQTYALADFNGDGVTDVAVADFLSDTVSVMAGDGAGYFHSVTRLSPGGGPRAIVAADFNRDGATDLAVANFFSGGVVIFLGQSGGQFQQSRELKLNTGLTTMIGADFDADGSVDLAAANFLSGEIVILKGVGDGSFAAPLPVGIVRAVTLILSHDADRDGQPDVLAIGAGGKEASLFANQGRGVLRYVGTMDLATALSSEREQKSMPQTRSSDQSRVLKKLYGDGQPVPAGFELSQPLVVEAGELSGQLVAGEPVTFSKLAGEARWEDGTARLTDERGQVSLAPSLDAFPGNHLIAAMLPGSTVNVFGLLSTLSAEAYTKKIKAALAQSSLAESERQELLIAIEDKLKADDMVEAVEGLTKSFTSLAERLPQQPGGENTSINPIELLKRLTNQVLLLGSATSVEVALTISCGQTVSGNISQAGQQDSYTFNGNAGEVVTISVAPTSGDLCPRAFLHTPSGTLLGSTTVCGSSTGPLTLPVTGTYTILVRDVFGSRTGAYDLNLQFVSGRCATAIACGETKSRNFTSPAQQDAYSFSGNVDEVVTVSVAPTSGNLCPRAYLYRASGVLIGTTTVCGSSTDSLRLPATGTYTIIVRDVFTGRTGAYDLNLQFVSGRCATAIACGETKSRSFTSPAQQDAYSFSGTVDEVVTISIAPTSGNLCPRAYLYRSSGVLIGTTTVCGSSTDSLRLPTTGAYTIIVRDVFTSRTGAYDLNLQFVSGRCAKPISCGETKSGNIASPAQQDAFSFCGTAGSSVQISIAATSGNLCPRAYLYNSSGALLGTTTVCGSTTNSIALTAGGNYTIIVRDVFTSRTGGYNVSLSCIGNSCPQSFSALGRVTSGSGAGISGATMTFTRISGIGTVPAPAQTDASGNWTQTGFQPGTSYRVTPGRPGCTFNPTSRDFSSASTELNFTGACPARVVRVVSASGAPGNTVNVMIELVSQGDENALGSSLTFDTRVLSYQQATLGSDATGAAFNPNPTEVGQGRLGISLALPVGQRFNAGVRKIANVTFTIASGTSVSSTQIGFGDQPTLREVSDVIANRLSANYEPGTVTITTGIEADVAPRPNGDGRLSVIDWVQCGRFVAQLDTPASGSEFQRADCAPKETKGDGRLSLIDWVQCGRYAALLDPMMPAGGPTAPAATALTGAFMHARAETATSGPRTVRVINTSLQRGQRGAVMIELDAQGNENALSFSLNFDPAQLQFVSAAVGSGATGATLNVNSATGGRTGLVLVMPAGQVIAAGLRPIVNVTFEALSSGGAASTTISFGDQPIPREVSDPAANLLPAEFISGTVTFPGTGPGLAVTSISPANPTASSGEQSITVNGSAFQPGLTVTVTAPNGSQSTLGGAQIQNVTATSFVMRITLNAAGNWGLRVNNPDGRQSNTFGFTVIAPGNPAPALASLSPTSAIAGGEAFTLTVTGANFTNSSVVRWNGGDRLTTFVSGTQLTAAIPASDIAAAGTGSVTVFNPPPGSGLSNTLTFSITPPTSSEPEQEPNETTSQANPLAIPGGRTGSAAAGDAASIVIVYPNGDRDGIEDLFVVTLTQRARLDLTLGFSNPSADLDLFLLNIGGLIRVLGASNGPGATTERILSDILEPGRYFVGVSAFRGSSSYTLTAAQAETQIEIIPANPTANDQVAVRLSGLWPNTCVPLNPALSVVGNEVRINTSNPGQPCDRVITSWSLSVPTGRLAAGVYQVVATHSSSSGQTELGGKSFTVANPSPPPTLALSFNGKARDRVGQGETALGSDGAPDGTFTVTLAAGEMRTINRLDLVRSGGGRWNTIPDDGFWVAGAANSLDDPLLNSPTGAVNFLVAGGGSFNLFASDYDNGLFNPGDSFTLTINFADGTTATASTMVTARSARAVNSSTPTQCAEEDNVNVSLAGKVAAFTIEATQPTYPVTEYSCPPNFDNCGPPATGFPFTPGVFKLFDDGETVFEAVREASWWRPNGMAAAADDRPAVADVHYIRLYRRIAGTSEYPQVLVLYQDGNLRLIPHPPAGVSSVCFGSSVIVGSAAAAPRPIAEITSVTYFSSSKSLVIKYKDGGSATIVVQEVTRQLARVRVIVNYPTENFPFATFRSMFVAEGNADVDRVKWVDAAGAMHDDPILAFTGGEGTEWLFYRQTRSRHNMSAPDIRIRLDARP